MSDVESKIKFLLETEKLKDVLRKTRPVGLSRFENSAEHSWQATLTAMLFLPEELNSTKVLKMLILHDLVEIDAGDVFVYDDEARANAFVGEKACAERLFAILPKELGAEFMAIWLEFEASETPEAKFAKAIDRVCPVVQNLNRDDTSWNEHKITREQVLDKNREIENADPKLWEHLEAEINKTNIEAG